MSDTPIWRKLFKSPAEMTEIELPMLIERFLPPGVTFIGGPAGHGKSWLALSIAKALITGQPFLGYFKIPKPVPVIYLVPEVGETAMKQRLKLLGLGDITENFYMQTMSFGVPVELSNGNLLEAMRDLKPAVFLDTAARFNRGEDENASVENKTFVDNVFRLLQHGAQAVIPLHHSIKSLAEGTIEPTLENVLRGSGDIGAMADAVYCSLCSDKTNFISEITNVKARDFTPTESFEIQGRPYITDTQDLKMIRPPDVEKEEYNKHQSDKAAHILTKHPDISLNELAKELNVRKPRAKTFASYAGYTQKGRHWNKK
jgi:RecA-family ATPase